ncbi:hypothetical protein H072_4830 [Dactylellina haptotyla CBS 200.50]|uniref:Uncharacterized protein n=1 Tax=Dactylellina haptotyla (strain CBS 200.50) TaxID=1284197 RepID=S8C0S9_DACHA|nr:hypothetical protein H072_4830 [Dactylellina haptotyla CBS 200.50]
MKISAAVLGAVSLPFGVINAAAISKRSEQISLKGYKYEGGILSGEATVQYMNCGRQNPRVQVFWAAGDSWTASKDWAIEAGKVFPPEPSQYQTYTFQGKAPNATQFYLKYTCYLKEFYDPGNFVNYHIN